MSRRRSSRRAQARHLPGPRLGLAPAGGDGPVPAPRLAIDGAVPDWIVLFGELSDEYWDRVKGHRRAGDALHEASEQQYERALQLDPRDNVALDRLAIMRF